MHWLGGALLAGWAWALPPALLGPEGPTWFGTVIPGEAASGAGRPQALVVDVQTGALHLEERDNDQVVREWAGRRWTVGGGGVDEAWPPRDGFRYELDSDGRLVSSTGGDGAWRRYVYDDADRLTGVLWPDGERLRVRYDAEGRVSAIDGPGRARLAMNWRPGGAVEARDGLGRVTRVRPVPGGDLGDTAWEVVDAAGRVVRTWYRGEGPQRRVAAWQDPRGLVTRVVKGDDGLLILGATGAQWRVGLSPEGRPTSVVDPIGGLHAWRRDKYGRVVRIVDESGRVVVWRRDADGHIVTVERSGQITRLGRDGQGRVVSIGDPVGGTTRLDRDGRGNVVAAVDAAGNAVQLERNSYTGRVDAVVSRTGARWSFSYDLLGRVGRVVDPTGRTVELHRDGAGRLVRVRDERFGGARILRGADGLVTGVQADDGRVLGLLRDPEGRLARVRLPSGGTMALERDAAGDIAALVGPWGDVPVLRDGIGRPIQVGPVAWRWDAAGRLVGVDWPGVQLRARLDASGRLEEVHAGKWRAKLTRDGAGRVVAWGGSDAGVRVRRDAGGRVVSEETLLGESKATRDPRGLVSSVDVGTQSWRWSRDAAGRVLRVAGPDGLVVGVDRDMAGRPKILRVPGGAMATWAYEKDLVQMTVTDGGGRVALVRVESRSADGRVMWRQEGDGPRVDWRRDPDGRLVAIAAGEGAGWRFDAAGFSGPAGEAVQWDVAGGFSRARVGSGPDAWGIRAGVLQSVADATTGRLAVVAGPDDRTQILWDAVGRVAGVSLPDGLLAIHRDAAGRVVGWTDPVLGRSDLVRAPGSDDLVGSGPNGVRTWVPGPLGPAGWRQGELEVGIVVSDDRDPVAVQAGRQPAVAVVQGPTGFPDSGAAGLVGADGWLQPRAGGPLFRGAVAVDPVGGRRVDGLAAWPWAPLDVRGTRSEVDLLDPRYWAPEGPWADPLRLLVATGGLEPVDDGAWSVLMEEAGALPWLAGWHDTPQSPLGPTVGALPIALDAVTACVVASVLPGGAPLEPDALLVRVIQDEVDLSGLPPGIRVPGLDWVPWGTACGGSALARPGTGL
jgi:YD repeat-containing protein